MSILPDCNNLSFQWYIFKRPFPSFWSNWQNRSCKGRYFSIFNSTFPLELDLFHQMSYSWAILWRPPCFLCVCSKVFGGGFDIGQGFFSSKVLKFCKILGFFAWGVQLRSHPDSKGEILSIFCFMGCSNFPL